MSIENVVPFYPKEHLSRYRLTSIPHFENAARSLQNLAASFCVRNNSDAVRFKMSIREFAAACLGKTTEQKAEIFFPVSKDDFAFNNRGMDFEIPVPLWVIGTSVGIDKTVDRLQSFAKSERADHDAPEFSLYDLDARAIEYTRRGRILEGFHGVPSGFIDRHHSTIVIRRDDVKKQVADLVARFEP